MSQCISQGVFLFFFNAYLNIHYFVKIIITGTWGLHRYHCYHLSHIIYMGNLALLYKISKLVFLLLVNQLLIFSMAFY